MKQSSRDRLRKTFLKKQYHSLTSRDRPKSAPYLRLKNSKRTSKCQTIGELGTLYGKKILENSHNAEKKLKGAPFGLVRYCMLRGKHFWFSSLGQRVQFGGFVKFCRSFGVELFWSLQVYRKKTLTKSHDYSRLFSLEKRRLKRDLSTLVFVELKFISSSFVFCPEKLSFLFFYGYVSSLVFTFTSEVSDIWPKLFWPSFNPRNESSSRKHSL